METEECDLSFAYDVGNWSKVTSLEICCSVLSWSNPNVFVGRTASFM